MTCGPDAEISLGSKAIAALERSNRKLDRILEVLKASGLSIPEKPTREADARARHRQHFVGDLVAEKAHE